MWAIPASLFFFAFLHRVAPGVIVKDIMQAFGASGEIIGLLSAMYFYAYAALMIPAGLLIDSFGVRRVVAAGSAVMGLGSLAMAIRDISVLIYPFMPTTSVEIQWQLGLLENKESPCLELHRGFKEGTVVRKGKSLFPRIELSQTK